MANFVLNTHMTNGDVLPFLRLASALHKRGHRTTLVTHGVFGDLAEKAGIEFRAIDASEDYTEIMKDLQLIEDPLNKPDLVEAYQSKYYSREKFRKEYDILSELCERDNSVLICRERDGFVAMMVSEVMNTPIATGVLAPSYATQLLIWEELELDYLISLINTFREDIGLQPVTSWSAWMGGVKKNIGFWHETFDRAVETPEWALKVETVGFPMADSVEYEPLPLDLIDFIQAGEPPLLITGGTGKMIKPLFYKASIEACKLMKRRTILVTRHDEFVHCELPDYIKWYRILPLAGVYPLVGAVIHHGGIGTITGAMSAGVPQLALAADTDRPDNGMRIKQLGIGDYLPPLQWDPHIIANTVNGILTTAVKKRCMDLAEIINNHDTMNVACMCIEEIVGNMEYAIASDVLQAESIKVGRLRAVRNKATEAVAGGRELTDERRTLLMLLLLNRQVSKRQGGEQ